MTVVLVVFAACLWVSGVSVLVVTMRGQWSWFVGRGELAVDERERRTMGTRVIKK